MMEWDYELNDVNPCELSPNNSKKAYWICPVGHHYKSPITKRNHGQNCPVCVGKQIIVGVNDFASLQPKLASEWDYEKNELLPINYTEHSNKKVFWRCSICMSVWEAPINQRVQGKYRCPNCNNKRRKQ